MALIGDEIVSQPSVSQCNRLPLRQIAEGSANDPRSGVLHHRQQRARRRRKVQSNVQVFSHRGEAVGGHRHFCASCVGNVEVACEQVSRRESEHRGDDMSEKLKARERLKVWFHSLICMRPEFALRRFAVRLPCACNARAWDYKRHKVCRKFRQERDHRMADA
jgi:hypothetical protein